ncbi:MAG: hypothetical protein ACE5Z5_03485 [Candidatus Bathyarchaeia archaeon]
MRKLSTVETVSIGLNAALYAGFGYLTYLGIFTPVIGVVRFWPSVIIPAVFSILFGPLAGGLGAALGIFISDMAIHHNALLSLAVGVPSNFVGFYLVGYIGRKNLENISTMIGLVFGGSLTAVVIALLQFGFLDHASAVVYASACLLSVVLALILSVIGHEWRSLGVASIVGLSTGSGIIGIGVWAFSQFFILPSGETQLPLYASALWFTWTYCTEIPFLLTLVPPILRACYAAFPSLRPGGRLSLGRHVG